ncbi:MAG: GNAT family N-acetyltransferase [Caulobacteraceae bacterium]|nr:GNAT family N-acetyltransferase [Caulobacteraceae bacterium]
MGEHPAISTPRLTLRAPAPEDAETIALLAGDLDVARMTTRVPHPYSRADADQFISRMQGCDLLREVAFAIDCEGAGLVGMIGLHPTGRVGPEIGYWIGRPYWGRGIATEAAAAALAWAGKDWGRRVVVSGHFADNPASGRVLEKAGFLYTGEIEPRRSAARTEAAPTRMMVWLA